MLKHLWTLPVCLILVLSASSHADDWPHWRGLKRDATTKEPSHFKGGNWPPHKPAWSTKTGAGGSAVIVIGSRLYTMGWKDGNDQVLCIDTASGKTLWTQSYRCPPYGRQSEGDKGIYSGPSSCPSYDRQTGYLYTLSTDGDLRCWDTAEQGQAVWNLNLYDTYQVAKRPKVGRRQLRDYGYTTAPLLQGEMLVVEVGDDEGNLMGFSKRTGERLWVSESKDPAGHTGGLVPLVVEGIPCVAVLTIRNLLVARLDHGQEGKTVAEFPWVTDFANNVATPAVLGNSIVISSEYNQYMTTRIDVALSGMNQVWKQPYASGVCPPVIYNGHVYWCWRGVYCLDFETGKPVWRGGIFGDTASCIVTSDGRLVIWGRRGDLVLAETADRSPRQYKELARQKDLMENDAWPHIVLSGGQLYCKDRDGNMKCFLLKQ